MIDYSMWHVIPGISLKYCDNEHNFLIRLVRDNPDYNPKNPESKRELYLEVGYADLCHELSEIVQKFSQIRLDREEVSSKDYDHFKSLDKILSKIELFREREEFKQKILRNSGYIEENDKVDL